ncbi:NAD-dependent succinate-semialdehyde dehydrogenase [Spirulina subsalsa FACHB-351]|uniref:NAD-dependent succinate-semialdehyde dehydrogenase n=1 Tax=Spirulina subsalsa FACHB-351 TaxID=234711 RepID=A0ABT3LBI4_9CYAN|nr:NAD-dependent succinate-semialdehyde dehydrogenase [Spirulina subsalsa]MCW6038837.1 NAD-dependent succinate-semialdehyde dehydrogenase [Spirulina subsalsa FACHB-351]
MAIATVSPVTGETLKTFTPLTSEEIQSKIAIAQTSLEAYRNTTFAQRSQWLHQAADLLEKNSTEYGKIMTVEMGKTLKSAIAEAKKCALVCRYYADHGAEFLKDIPGESDGSAAFVRYQPLGVILAVMPWNFPFWQVFRFAAPALMAGNVGLLKHASNVPQCAIAIQEIIEQAGFPPGVFQTLLIGASQVEEVLADERVQAATLTGSEYAGASLAATAGKYIKKTVLELGGSDPFIVLNSADLELAVSTAVTARMLNNGQSCIAAKRFILQTGIADQFIEQLTARFEALKIGDPMDDSVDVGPLATASIRQEIDQQVQKTVAMGGKVLTGGHPLDRPGNFYPPTILTDIPPDSPGALEEFFGPVALVFRVNDLEEAIRLANGINLGLGASVWTEDEGERDRLINDIEAGAVFVNGLVKSDPRLPFGGIKRSGYGRELSIQGIQEFVNIKTVWIR